MNYIVKNYAAGSADDIFRLYRDQHYERYIQQMTKEVEADGVAAMSYAVVWQPAKIGAGAAADWRRSSGCYWRRKNEAEEAVSLDV